MQPSAATIARLLLLWCLAFACSAQAGATALPVLSERVDVGTVASLVILAARDRICFADSAKKEVFKDQAYRRCMQDRQQLGACEVTAGDVQQLRALLLADRQLQAVASLEAVIAHLAAACTGGLDPRIHAELSEQPTLPEQCSAQTPLLIAHAVELRIPQPTNDARMQQRVECYSVLGRLHLSDECRQWARPLGRSLAELQARRPRYLDYFCPLKRN